MSDLDQLKGTPFENPSEKKTAPGSLKALTILTFIGSGILLLLSLVNMSNAKKGLEQMEKMQGSDALEKMPGFFKQFYTPEAIEMARISYENRIPLTILGLLGLALCIYGAIQMRSLQKQGFYLWLIGNILPLIGNAIFIGIAALTGFMSYFFIGIFVLFLILYSTQLKYMK